MTPKDVYPHFVGGSCSKRTCDCRKWWRWTVCLDGFKDFGDTYGCWECGWDEQAHERPENVNALVRTRAQWERAS